MIGTRKAAVCIRIAGTWFGRLAAVVAVMALGRPTEVAAVQSDSHPELNRRGSVVDDTQITYLEVGDAVSEDDDNPPIPE